MTSQGRKCVDNVIMYAENVIRHPQYDDDGLLNDIALIKLRGNAPYTGEWIFSYVEKEFVIFCGTKHGAVGSHIRV